MSDNAATQLLKQVLADSPDIQEEVNALMSELRGVLVNHAPPIAMLAVALVGAEYQND